MRNLNLHYKSLIVNILVKKFFLQHGLYLNKFHFRINHNEIEVFATSLGVFREHKLKRRVLNYRKKLFTNSLLTNLAEFILKLNIVDIVKLNFYHIYLPRKLIAEEAIKIFRKQKKRKIFLGKLATC